MAAGNSINEATTGIVGFTGSAFTATPVIQHDVIIGGATSSTLTNVSPSTATFVLTSNGVSADPSFQAIPGSFSPNSVVNLYDDFIGSINSSSNIASNLSWLQSNFLDITQANDNAHPGVICSVSLTVAGTAYVMLGELLTSSVNAILLGGGAITINWVFKINTLSDGTNRYILYMGLGDTTNAASDQSNGCYISYSDNLNSANWIGNTASASSRSTRNSSTAVTTGWHNAQVVINAAGTSITYFMDGVSLGAALTTNIPVTSIAPFIKMDRTAGTIPVDTLIPDLMYLTQTLTVAR